MGVIRGEVKLMTKLLQRRNLEVTQKGVLIICLFGCKIINLFTGESLPQSQRKATVLSKRVLLMANFRRYLRHRLQVMKLLLLSRLKEEDLRMHVPIRSRKRKGSKIKSQTIIHQNSSQWKWSIRTALTRPHSALII